VGELLLNDGNVIGHRSLIKYYKMNYKPRESRDSVLISQMLAQYRALALPGYSSKIKTSERTRFIAQYAQKQRFRAEKAANSQEHYRAQIM